MLESLGVTKKILKKGEVEKIKLPVLLVQATQDNIVLLEPQNAFVRRLPDGKIVYATCKHETFDSPDEVWRDLIAEILGFLS